MLAVKKKEVASDVLTLCVILCKMYHLPFPVHPKPKNRPEALGVVIKLAGEAEQ